MARASQTRRLALAVLAAALVMPVRASLPSEAALLELALDTQSSVAARGRAFADLRAVATDRAIPALTPLLNDPAWAYPARSVLEVMPGPAADRALLAALASTERGPLRAGLLNSLGNRRTAEAVPVIAKFLESPDAAVAEAAMSALGSIGNVPAGDALAAFQPSAALSVVWADAMVRVAEALPLSDRAKALELYRRVLANGAAPHIAAANGVEYGTEPPAVPFIAAALSSPEPGSRLATLTLIRAGAFGPELTAEVARIFPSLSPAVQVQVLSVLQDRGDRTAAPIARPALTATDPAVRAAAARLLSVVGDASDASALRRMMTGAGEPGPSVRLALARLPGNETTVLLLERFHHGGAERGAALEVLVARGYRPLVPELLQPKLYVDPALGRQAANALLTLGTDADFGRALALYGTLPEARRDVLTAALKRLAAKHSSPDEAGSLVVAAAEKLPPTERIPLLAMLPGIGGDRAFASLSGMLQSTSAETRKVASRAFANWPDIRAATPLLALARSDPDPTVRFVAVQSATAVFRKSALGLDNTPVPARVPPAVEGLRQTWELAEQADAKDAVIAALRGLKDPRAIAAAGELEKQAGRAK